MNKLPTRLARHMLENHFSVRMIDTIDTVEAVGTYQRMSLVTGQSEAWEATLPWFRPEHRTVLENTPEYRALTAVHTLAKKDVLGQAVDCLVGIINNATGSTKEKIAAATIINELYGEKQLTNEKGLADRLILNLGGHS